MIALTNPETLAMLEQYARARGCSPQQALEDLAAVELRHRLKQMERVERLRAKFSRNAGQLT